MSCQYFHSYNSNKLQAFAPKLCRQKGTAKWRNQLKKIPFTFVTHLDSQQGCRKLKVLEEQCCSPSSSRLVVIAVGESTAKHSAKEDAMAAVTPCRCVIPIARLEDACRMRGAAHTLYAASRLKRTPWGPSTLLPCTRLSCDAFSVVAKVGAKIRKQIEWTSASLYSFRLSYSCYTKLNMNHAFAQVLFVENQGSFTFLAMLLHAFLFSSSPLCYGICGFCRVRILVFFLIACNFQPITVFVALSCTRYTKIKQHFYSCFLVQLVN